MRVEASGYGYDCVKMVTTLTLPSPYEGEGEFRYQQS